VIAHVQNRRVFPYAGSQYHTRPSRERKDKLSEEIGREFADREHIHEAAFVCRTPRNGRSPNDLRGPVGLGRCDT